MNRIIKTVAIGMAALVSMCADAVNSPTQRMTKITFFTSIPGISFAQEYLWDELSQIQWRAGEEPCPLLVTDAIHLADRAVSNTLNELAAQYQFHQVSYDRAAGSGDMMWRISVSYSRFVTNETTHRVRVHLFNVIVPLSGRVKAFSASPSTRDSQDCGHAYEDFNSPGSGIGLGTFLRGGLRYSQVAKPSSPADDADASDCAAPSDVLEKAIAFLPGIKPESISLERVDEAEPIWFWVVRWCNELPGHAMHSLAFAGNGEILPATRDDE